MSGPRPASATVLAVPPVIPTKPRSLSHTYPAISAHAITRVPDQSNHSNGGCCDCACIRYVSLSNPTSDFTLVVLNRKTQRCATHCWFLFACSCFVLFSSSPRILCLVDFAITFLVCYLQYSMFSMMMMIIIYDDNDSYMLRMWLHQRWAHGSSLSMILRLIRLAHQLLMLWYITSSPPSDLSLT
jgi:hypothetical protein